MDLSRLLVGNWLGAGAVAASALVSCGLLAVAVALLGKPTDFGWDNSLTLVAALMAGAFGADLTAEFGVMDFRADASIGSFPLTITVITLVVAVLAFRRVTAGYARGIDALADAARAALIFGLALLAVALVIRSDTREFGRDWGAELSRSFDARIEYGADAAGAFFLGFLILFAVLAVSCLGHRGRWPAQVGRAREWLAAPLYGVGAFAALLPLAGVIGLLLLLVSGDAVDDVTEPSGSELRFSVALIFALLANGGMWLLGLGAGSAFGTRSGGDDGSTNDTHHLAHYAAESPALWAAPVVLLAVLTLIALVVARRAPGDRVLPNLLLWVGSFLITIPLFVRVSGLRGEISIEGNGENYDGWGSAGLVGWQATLLVTLTALVVALLVAWRHGALDPAQLRSRATELGRRIQSNPGRVAPQEQRPDSSAEER